MRHRYVVAYDVSDPKRLRRVHRKLKGFGDPLQYSVFQCDLSDTEKLLMVGEVVALINEAEDRVMIVDAGPVAGRGGLVFEYLGRRPEVMEEEWAAIV